MKIQTNRLSLAKVMPELGELGDELEPEEKAELEERLTEIEDLSPPIEGDK